MSDQNPYRDPYADAYGAHDPYAADTADTRVIPTTSNDDAYAEYQRQYEAYYGPGSWDRAQAAASATASATATTAVQPGEQKSGR